MHCTFFYHSPTEYVGYFLLLSLTSITLQETTLYTYPQVCLSVRCLIKGVVQCKPQSVPRGHFLKTQDSQVDLGPLHHAPRCWKEEEKGEDGVGGGQRKQHDFWEPVSRSSALNVLHSVCSWGGNNEASSLPLPEQQMKSRCPPHGANPLPWGG